MKDSVVEITFNELDIVNITIDANIKVSDQAASLIKEKVLRYSQQIIAESKRLSEKDELDSISAAQVEKASEYLNKSEKRNIWYRILGILGGILLGLAVTNIFTVSNTSLSVSFLIKTVICAVLGAFFIAIDLVTNDRT